MSNQGMSRKSLIFSILAAVMVLTMVLCMTGCKDEQAAATTTVPAATGDSGAEERVDLYWNVDRALYDGKSEAGMSSRMPGEDGYFHVRFFKDGEFVELRVADRKTVNSLEVQNLMGLEFDDDGIVVGVIEIDDMPIEKLAWQFYVQSAGGNLIKTNSSNSMNGMEILLETDENTGIYDMSGVTGEIGPMDDLMQGDRVLAVGNADGVVTHVFVYERPNYMQTHEAECEHCEKTVTWYEWNKESALPINTGHYQLVVDVKGVKQTSMVEDAKICLDLNGHRVDGNSGSRIYSLHNAGTELALMDTSEAKTGRIAAHGKGDQGMCVWLRYGVFYLYDGILDGSDATTTLNGPTVNMNANTYFYMYGGELIGGTADMKSNGKGGWSGGAGGNLFIGTNAKFVMHDGIIRGGRAKTRITAYTAAGLPNGYTGGVGGNIFANTGAVIELNGGEIRDGIGEHHSGNIYLGGKVELTINATLISGGRALGRTANGGNLFVSGTASVVMNGGTIRNGRVYNCAGNVYINGRFQMNDGIITDGKCINWTTKKANDAAASRNVFSVNGDFYMYGGRVAGGFQCVDTAAGSNDTILVLSARSVIFDEDGTGPHLSLSGAGDPCIVMVGQMHNEGKIGISAVQKAVFTKPTKVDNTDNFISDIDGADIGWTDQGLAIGKIHCLCSQDPNIADDAHKLGCDKVQYAWAPWTSTTALPTAAGYWYLTKDVTTTGNQNVYANGSPVVHVALDLNGKTIQSNGGRMYSLFENTSTYLADGKTVAPNIEGEALHLTLTDTLGGGTVNFKTRTDCDQGTLVWGRWPDSKINILGGTYNCTNVTSKRHQGAVITASGELNIYGGTLNGGNSTSGGIISGNNINIYGGTIQNGTASSYGGNIYSKGTVNIYGGTITGGKATRSDGNYAQGGNIWMSGASAVLNIDGEAVISNGYVYTLKDGKSSWAPGGNIYVNAGAKVTIDGGAIIEAGDSNDGNNLYMTGASTTMNLLDCTIRNNTGTNANSILVESGTLTIDGAELINERVDGRNIATNTSGTNVAKIVLESGTISSTATSKNNGGNIILYRDDFLTVNGGTITGGHSSDSGGNIVCYGTMTMTGGLITNGRANRGPNISIVKATQADVATLNLSGGTIAGGLHFNNYAGHNKINISGNPVVDKSKATAHTPAYSMLLDANDLNVGTLTSGAKFYVSGTGGVFTNAVPSNYTDYFKSEVEGSSVLHTADGLFLGKAMCVCGGKAVGVGDHECKDVLWTPWNSDKTLPTTTGNYYLTKNVTSGGVAFKNAGTINIDLNGFDYIQNGGDRAFRVRDDDNKYDAGAFVVTIGLTDSKGGGEVKVTHGEAQDGTVVWLTEATNTFNMYAGILDASGVTTTTGRNGTAVKTLSKSVFNMYGGEIKGGNSPYAGGGAVAIYDTSTFNMYAGKVSGGKTGSDGGNFIVFANLNVFDGLITGGEAINPTTDTKKGGNIIVQSGGTVRISGGTISDGVSDDSGCNIHVLGGGKLYISGGTITGGYRLRGTTKTAPAMSNVFSVNGYVEISGGTINGLAVTNTTAANSSVLKISGDPVIGTTAEGHGLHLAVAEKATAAPAVQLGTLTNGASIAVSATGVITNVTDAGNAQYFHPVDEANTAHWIDDAAAFGVAAVDKGKIFVGKVMCVCGGKAVGVGDHVCKNVAWTTWTETKMPTASGNYILTKPITTSQTEYTAAGTVISLDLNGQTITGATGKNGRVLRITNGAVVNVTDTAGNGKIIGKGHETDQGGLLIMAGKAKFNLYAGTLTSDRTHNTPQGGGVLYLTQQGTTVTMYGGEISNGKTTAAGGNIWVNSNATFIMYAGKVSGGAAKAASYANIHCKMSNVEFYGGEIDGGVMVQNWNKEASTIKIAGNPVIYKEGATHNLNLIWSTGNSSPANYPVIELGKLEAGAKIDVTVDGYRVVAAPSGSYVITDTDAACFTADSCGRKVVLKDGKLETAAP